jgi:type IV pilus assembly protein PilY1
MERIMKTKKAALLSRKPTLLQTMAVVGITALVTLSGLPVHAATSFPNYPLLTGGNAIPPNIMMILDDSGSMNFIAMPTDIKIRGSNWNAQNGLNDNPTDRSYINNTLYYDPRTDYLPWRTSNTDLDDRLAAADFKDAASSPINYTGSKVDLRTATSGGIQESYFYVPKSGVSNPGTTASNYDKYRIGSSSSSTSYSGGAVQKLTSTTIDSETLANIRSGNWSSCTAVPVSGFSPVTITVSGSTRADLYVYSTSNCSADWQGNGLYGRDNGNGNPKSLTITPNAGATDVYLRVFADGGNVNGPVYTAVGTSWPDMTPSGNTSALQQAELQNFANWYQYHRTRNKMAKAGASEAFGRLGANYRVGFDTIWNRNAGGTTINTSGNVPAYPIPIGTDGALFKDANRSDFYARLQGANADGGTPLKGALQRAARYYQTDDPWKDSNGDLLTCRQNYAILTTDGYWNDNSGYTDVGNADAATARDVDGNAPQYPDTYSDTLADVAYRYWSTDLRTAMANNVLTSAADPADWQHMVTFGVSIGLQGTLNPNNPAPSPWNVNPDAEGPRRIDDLWHASLNGRGKFVVASNSDKFASALIDALAAIDSRSASGSNIASSSTKTDTTTLTFVAGFTSGTWTGDLIASPFNAALSGVSSQPKWILSKTFPGVTDTGNVYDNVNANFASRTVLTMKGGTASLFGTTMAGASDFGVRTGLADAVTAADNIAYLKGNQSKELGQTNGTLRKRAWPIGDIVDSSPAYVEDTKTVYVGANDGMLHGIDTDTGEVLFSYVPKGIDFAAMANLSATSYDHRYFVDGQIEVIGQANQGNDKNILIGALGRGGRGVFALDVTDPDSMGENDVLWDNTTQDSTTNTNMGYVLGAVRIRKGNGGKTYAFVPNGIDSPNGSSTLFVYELDADGAIVGTPTELVADAGGGNGLMSLGMADLNADGTVDVVYGGDLKGNVYRWDFSTAVLPTAAVKLFQATDTSGAAQPITGGIGVGRDTSGNVFVGFGTGRFISSNDMPGVATQQVQSIYGIKDENATVASRSDLQVRTIPFEGTIAGAPVRGFENYSALSASMKGWYIDLATPERVISAPTIYGTAMVLSSVIPATGSDCAGATGSGFLNAINLFTGTSPESGSGGYFGSSGTVTDANGNTGTLGGVGVTGGMPTEANVTSGLATVGTGAFSSEDGGKGNTSSTDLTPPPGGTPSRVNWREVIPND